MHRIVLVEFGVLLHLAHHDDDGGDAGEDAIVGRALVVLPGTDEMRNALMEELGVDLDLCHLDGNRARKMAGQQSVVGGCWRENAGRQRKGEAQNWRVNQNVAAPKI